MIDDEGYDPDEGYTYLRRRPPEPVPEPVEPEPEPDLLDDEHDPGRDPATWGRRGWWNRVLPFRLRPTPAEVEYRHAREWLQTQWSGTRLVMVANPKGGQAKTPGAWLLGALFGQARGNGVAGWDNAESGTLAMRATAASSRSTVWDLLANTEALAAASYQQVGGFMRKQPTGEHILAGDDSPVHTERITHAECDDVFNILSRHYDLIIADTGNDYLADRWLWTAKHADALVIPLQYWEVAAKMVSAMLDRLRSMGLGRLVESAVVVAWQPPGGSDPVTVARVRKLLQGKGVDTIIDVPFEPLFASCGRLQVPRLAAGTVQSWTRVAAEAAIVLDSAPPREGLAAVPVPPPRRRVAEPPSKAPPWAEVPLLVPRNGKVRHAN